VSDPTTNDGLSRNDYVLGLAEAEEQERRLSETSRQTLHVVMVDDEEALCHGVRRIVEKYSVHVPEVHIDVDFTFSSCGSGERLLALLADGTPVDVLLLDLKLPGVGGLEVLQEVGTQGGDTVTIVVTAYATFETAVKATKLGAYDFLAKPFTPDELRYVLRKATTQLVVGRQARRLAEEKRHVRFNFISVLAHELKAPLNAIQGYLNILRTTETGANLQMIERSLVRLDGMKKLIVDLLDMTRIESGQRHRELTQVDLSALARNTIDLFGAEAGERNITLDIRAPEGLSMVADASEIEIILNNLVSNAVKYNRVGGSVHVELQRSGSEITIAVRDTGIGLTAEEASKVFGEFVRIKNEDTVGVLGSGLGLSTVRKLAHLYGGEATVESERGVGSTFRVTLQDAAPGASNNQPGAARQLASSQTYSTTE